VWLLKPLNEKDQRPETNDMNNQETQPQTQGVNEGSLHPLVRTFREDGWVAEVEVLEDTSDTEWERYKLKVIRTLRDSAIVKTPPDGEIFDVCSRKNCGCCSGLWHLS
jgi:hypothetical protein